jgi:hypothetical protein
MLKVGDDIELSASDLVSYLYCRYLTDLDLAVATGQLEKPKHGDRFLDLLQERGAIHEKAFLDHLKSEGYQVFEVEGIGTDQALVDQTITAMRAGAEIIVLFRVHSGGSHCRAHWPVRRHVTIGVVSIVQSRAESMIRESRRTRANYYARCSTGFRQKTQKRRPMRPPSGEKLLWSGEN